MMHKDKNKKYDSIIHDRELPIALSCLAVAIIFIILPEIFTKIYTRIFTSGLPTILLIFVFTFFVIGFELIFGLYGPSIPLSNTDSLYLIAATSILAVVRIVTFISISAYKYISSEINPNNSFYYSHSITYSDPKPSESTIEFNQKIQDKSAKIFLDNSAKENSTPETKPSNDMETQHLETGNEYLNKKTEQEETTIETETQEIKSEKAPDSKISLYETTQVYRNEGRAKQSNNIKKLHIIIINRQRYKLKSNGKRNINRN